MTSDTFTVLEAFNLAASAYSAGRLSEAEQLCRRAVRGKQDFFEALYLLANIQMTQGRFTDALTHYDLALVVRSNSAETYSNRALALHCLQRYEQALVSYERALAIRPHYPQALYNRGNSLQSLGRFEEALDSYDQAISLQSDYLDALVNRAAALHALSRYDDALISYDSVLTLKPDYPEVIYNRGNTFLALKRFDEAIVSFERALSFRADYIQALSNRGIALQELKRFDEAVASYESALAIRPEYADAHYNEALCLLLTGDFERGWEKLEWRWQAEGMRSHERHFSQPQWRGLDDLADKTILLHAEQGFGDTIQFCRYVPLVAKRAARVILEVQEPLHNLMQTLEGATQIISRGHPLPDFDMHCPLLSLPLAFGTRINTIPNSIPYLSSPLEVEMEWATRLRPRHGAKIGVAWRRSHLPDGGIDGSMRLETLLPLLDEDATFVSLQRDLRKEEEVDLQGRSNLLTFEDDLLSISAIVGLIANLDLVISVDTDVVHLAGAMGKPVWLLLPHTSDWRWLLDRRDTPWYPTAKLFRQEGHGWSTVIGQVKLALDAFITKIG